MAATKESIYNVAYQDARGGGATLTVYKEGSWQAKAYKDGWTDGVLSLARDRNAAESVTAFNGASGNGCTLRPFPRRMPAVTCEHVMRLNKDALSTPGSSRALRLDNKINALYQRYA